MANYYTEKEEVYYSVDRFDLIPLIPNNLIKVLDIGCSNGNFGSMLKRKFNVKEVWGIEPFTQSAKQAMLNLDKVLNLPIEEAFEQLEGQQFDCIFFNDVLEHLVDPYSILQYIQKYLSPDGYVFASMPNVLQFDNLYRIIRTRDWKYEPHGIMDKTHLRFFTKQSIQRMFSEAGYTIKLVQGINPKSGKMFRVFRTLFGKRADDFKYVQFVIIGNKHK